ncbi:NAD-dependent malic enzyme, partial [Bittarella massiliensis]|nr:NAD-dependent malic enzyme [Bittarella massiliensis (ex Durand et al. 2017)]
VCDRFGILNRQEPEKLNPSMLALAQLTIEECWSGTLADALKGADVFVGVSAPGIVSREMVASMAKDAIVFPMANPNPELTPDEAKAGGAQIVGTGPSD